MRQLFIKIRAKWEENPLIIVMYLAVFLRLISVLFAKGWGMLDDHFLVIEVSQSWADGHDIKHWLPWTPGNTGPEGHSFLYVGLHFFVFTFFNWIGFHDPQSKMVVIRLLHAVFSLITVYYGFKIAEKLSDKKTAGFVGLLLASYWFIPWSSVRNLVEIVAIPLLVLGTWMLMIADDKNKSWKNYLLAGLIVGFAFSIRYQTGIYGAGMGLVLLLHKKIKPLILFAIGGIVAVFLIQGCVDIAIWGRPFAEMGEYIQYNVDNRYNFFNGDWYNYFLLVGGLLIPPIGLFLMAGVFVNWKKHLHIFLPVVLFFAFHSYFPNKQERFILTIMPFIIILGAIGWMKIYNNSAWWAKHTKLHKGLWTYFWVLNAILLIPISTMYSKRSRAEAMTYLNHYENVGDIIVENSNKDKVDIMPQFYSGQKIGIREVTKDHPIEQDTVLMRKEGVAPKFVLFCTDVNLEKRVDDLKSYYPGLVFDLAAEPGLLDRVMHWLNPKNTNDAIYIYRNTKYFAEKK